MRITHYIKDNKTSSMPSEFIFFDTETTPKVNSAGDIDQPFKLGVALYWRRRADRESDTLEYYRFTNIAKFWKFVVDHTQDKHRLILVAHNLQFDFMVLGGFTYLRRLGFELTKLIVNGKVNIFTYRRGGATILCLDNMNYFSTSLKSLGENVGLHKMTMPKGAHPLKTWYAYCQGDVDIMYKAWKYWLDFLRDQDLGTFGNTLAGQSFNAFRHRFMSHNILISSNVVATSLERDSYRGGRVECFQLGQLPRQPYYLYDINSMYPYCMKYNNYPVRIRYLKDSPSIEFLARVLKNRCVIADVVIKTDTPAYSVKFSGRLISPVGVFRVTLNTAELRRAILHDEIQQIIKLAVYEAQPIFTDFVDYFYDQRLKFKAGKQPVFAYLCKNILNSLYGKFGQRNEEWEKIRTEPEPVDYVETEIDAQTGQVYTIRCIGGEVFKAVNKVEGYNSFAAISAEVTANARMMLFEFIEQAGLPHVYYCDTDSVLVDPVGSEALSGSVHPTELGKLKVARRSQHVILHNVKDYVIGKQVKIKGIPRKARRNKQGQYITYQQQGVRAALRAGNIEGMIWKRVPKRLARIYNKGAVIDGSAVRPLILTVVGNENWLDYEAMSDQYGEYATFRDKSMYDYLNPGGNGRQRQPGLFDDMSAADRLDTIQDDLDQRRDGNMIYQR